MTKEAIRSFGFNRMELAGSLGDLGTLLPLAAGMNVLSRMHASNLLVVVGLYYMLAGFHFKVPMPVGPMKAIGDCAVLKA
jgi:SulP family sulfate permease